MFHNHLSLLLSFSVHPSFSLTLTLTLILTLNLTGMDTAFDCSGYKFLDSRDKDGGRKNILKGLGKAHTAGRTLDRILRRQNSTLLSLKPSEASLRNDQSLIDKKLRYESFSLFSLHLSLNTFS